MQYQKKHSNINNINKSNGIKRTDIKEKKRNIYIYMIKLFIIQSTCESANRFYKKYVLLPKGIKNFLPSVIS